jgi:hypothetical protein
VAAQATGGNTTQNIAAALRIEIVRPRTGSAAQRAVIRSPTARPEPGNSSVDRAAICPATAAEEPASAIGEAVQALATGQAEAEPIV